MQTKSLSPGIQPTQSGRTMKKEPQRAPFSASGVADGARTHDNRNHNPGLYQLSYGHHLPPATGNTTTRTSNQRAAFYCLPANKSMPHPDFCPRQGHKTHGQQAGTCQTGACNRLMARQEGFEPPTYGLEGRCSIQLSYCRQQPAQPAKRPPRLDRNRTRTRAGRTRAGRTRAGKTTGPTKVTNDLP